MFCGVVPCLVILDFLLTYAFADFVSESKPSERTTNTARKCKIPVSIFCKMVCITIDCQATSRAPRHAIKAVQ